MKQFTISSFKSWSSLNEDFKTLFKVGDKVKIRDDSEYRDQAYYRGGNGHGQIRKIHGDDNFDDRYGFNYDIRWDNDYGDTYRIIDLDTSNVGNEKKKKIRRPDIDPLDEEDWGWEGVNEELNPENYKKINFKGILNKIDGESLLKLLNANYSGKRVFYVRLNGDIANLSKGIPYTIGFFYIMRNEIYVNMVEGGSGHLYELIFVDDVPDLFNLKMKPIRRPDIDPFDEEEWGWEEVQESVKPNLENLKKYRIKANNVKQAVSINHKLKELGFNQQSDNRVERHYSDSWNCFMFDPSFETDWELYTDYPFTSIIDIDYEYFMNMLNPKMKPATRPDIDPFGEEDWGWEEEQ